MTTHQANNPSPSPPPTQAKPTNHWAPNRLTKSGIEQLRQRGQEVSTHTQNASKGREPSVRTRASDKHPRNLYVDVRCVRRQARHRGQPLDAPRANGKQVLVVPNRPERRKSRGNRQDIPACQIGSCLSRSSKILRRERDPDSQSRANAPQVLLQRVYPGDRRAACRKLNRCARVVARHP